jgi:hypothetical protein
MNTQREPLAKFDMQEDGRGRWIYVAGPYAGGDVVANVRHAAIVGLELRRKGWVPLIPHLFHFLHLIEPQDHEVWLVWDIDLLRRCDIMLRIPGESKGADAEQKVAELIGIPVFELQVQ